MKPVERAFDGVHVPLVSVIHMSSILLPHLAFRNSLIVLADFKLPASNGRPALLPPKSAADKPTPASTLSLEAPVCPWLLLYNLSSLMDSRKVMVLDITSRVRFLHSRRRPKVHPCFLHWSRELQEVLRVASGQPRRKGRVNKLASEPSVCCLSQAAPFLKNQVYTQSFSRKRCVMKNSWKTTDPTA